MTRTSTPKILIVLTSHAELGATKKKTGAYLPELTHPHAVFRAAGFEVDFASVKGGAAPLDGVDRQDPVNAAFLDDAGLVKRLETTLSPSEVEASAYDAIFYAGGHGTMWDFPEEASLATLAARLYERGGVVGAVCHGPSALVNVTLSSGTPLVAGKEVAAFTNDEERAVGLTEVVPFLLADALAAKGAVHRPAPNWQKQVIVSERLVTGQNPASARGVAEAMVTLLSAD
ncbi:MAG: type 1 glutamine amidotransferase domain-containing protein [Sandaracinaceae bacterium]|nr:type 1 glutamine amidotransferase domain-containing protein [Sandaracinaceae bacterium]